MSKLEGQLNSLVISIVVVQSVFCAFMAINAQVW